MTVKSFPCSLIVKDRACWVIGAGREAIDKAAKLVKAGGDVRVIAEKDFRIEELENQFFVVLTIKGNPALTKKVAQRCREKRILLCAIDQPEYCDVTNVAVFERGALRISVSTDGVSPALARKIREGLEASLKDAPIESFLKELADLRKSLETAKPSDARIQKLIDAVQDVKFEAKMSIPKGNP